MHNFTKTLLTSLALTLAACDEPGADLGEDFGEGATEFRPGVGGFQLNTSFIGGHDYAELDLAGAFHKSVKLTKVCLADTNRTCLYPGVASKGVVPDRLWVEKSQLMGQKQDMVFKGKDFARSRWFLSLDHNRDGVIDSTVQLVINGVEIAKTVAPTPMVYWNYFWAFDSKTATGLLPKFIEQSEIPTPMCEVDADTGSLASVLLEDTSIDTSPTTKAIVEHVPNSMFVACHSGAAGKATVGWNYALYDVGNKVYTNIIRIMRADYGNDGMSFTAPGQKLTVTDDLSINKEWDPSLKLEGLISLDAGWLCIFQPRMVSLADVLAANPNISICDGSEELGDTFNGVVSNVVTQPL